MRGAGVTSPSGLMGAYEKGRSLAASQVAGAAGLLLGSDAVAGSYRTEYDGSGGGSGGSGTNTTHLADLHGAVERGEVDAVSELLNTGADVGMLDSDGRSPLLLATQGGYLPVVTLLLECGAADASCIPPSGPNGMCSLIKTAARKEYIGILRALILHGADVHATDAGGSTALQHAAMLGKSGSIDVLVEFGAEVDSADLDGCTALHWASMEGNSEAIVALLRHEADIDALDKEGRSPLHRACSIDDTHAAEAAELLLLWGADETIVDKDGHTAEYYTKVQLQDSNSLGGGGAKQRALESLLQLLRTTPTDRAWCRHGLVILCKTRLGHGAIGTVLDRLVTLEEEELFEKSWAVETDKEDDGGDEPQRLEEPVQVKEELRERREDHPPKTRKMSQAGIRPRQADDSAWIKPHVNEQAPQTWSKPQAKEELEDDRDKQMNREGPSWQNAKGGMKQQNGQQPSSSEFSRAYTLGKRLGGGGSGATFVATKRGSNSAYIVKRALQREAKNANEHALLEEVRILRLLTHPSVVAVEEVFRGSPDYIHVVLEHLSGGPVFDRIVKKTRFREHDARHLCRVLILSVQHCHDLGIVHRDLRPEHLLLTSRSDDATIKLVGFDFARSLPRDGHGGRKGRGLLTSQSYVTAEYAAPEVLRSVPHGTAVDMWSMGVIFYTLLGGYHPFHDERQPRLFRRIRDGSFVFHEELWGSISDEAKNFVGKLLKVEPSKRMTAKQALEHPWMLISGKELAKNDLGFNQEQLRVFNAASKLRAAIKSVMAARRALGS